jgi:hypothetical protein
MTPHQVVQHPRDAPPRERCVSLQGEAFAGGGFGWRNRFALRPTGSGQGFLGGGRR